MLLDRIGVPTFCTLVPPIHPLEMNIDWEIEYIYPFKPPVVLQLQISILPLCNIPQKETLLH